MTNTLATLTFGLLLAGLEPGAAHRVARRTDEDAFHGGPTSARGPVAGPQLWLVTRGQARVFVMGFGEAEDTSWLTPSIDSAFRASSQLWLENAGAHAADGRSPAERQASAERIEGLGRETGRTLFDVLEPSVRERTLAYLSELGVSRESVEGLRPWKAYYSIVSAFWSKRSFPFKQVHVDAVLEELGQRAGKRIGYEMPTHEAFVNFMASMSDQAQSQYVEWLLDFLDDYKNGLNDQGDAFGWIAGKPGKSHLRSLDRMRTKMPALYQVMQPRRNDWWARKIDELLAGGGTAFVAVGELHMLGPDGIPRQLERMGIAMELAP